MFSQYAQRGVQALAVATVLLFVNSLMDTQLGWLDIRTVRARAAPSQDGAVTLQLVDGEQKPIAGVEVQAFWLDHGRAYLAGSRTSGNEGKVELSSLPHGTIWLLARRRGFARTSRRVLVSSKPISERMVLSTAHSLTVRVNDSDGAAVNHASVQVTCSDPLPFVRHTDAAGQRRFTRLCAPPYRVQVTAPGYGSSVRHVVAERHVPLVVTLEKLGSVLVRVITEDGAPAPLSTVLLTGPGVWPARQTVTTAFGRASIAGLPKGIYSLRATRGELISKVRSNVEVTKGAVVDVTLTLLAGRWLTVRVVQGSVDNPAPVPKANIVVSEQGLSLFPNEAVVGEDGQARLGPFLPQTPLTVTASAPGYFPEGPVRLSEGERSAVVRLVRGGRIVGDVVDERGFPVPGASVEVIGTDLAGQPVSLTPEMVAFQRAHFTWGMGGPPKLIPIGQLGVMPGPIPPVPHANPWQTGMISARGSSASTAAAQGVRSWVTSGKGKFSAGPVPPGQLGVIVRHPAYVQALSTMVTVGPGGVGRVHVILYPGGTLQGVVLDDRRFPVEGALVRVVSTDGTNERSTLSGPDGSFSFSALPGEVLITAARPETTDQVAFEKKLTLDAGERKELEILLPIARESVAFRVVDDRGYPIDRAKIRVTSLTQGESLRRTTFTSNGGTAKVNEAADLDLLIEVQADGYAPLKKRVDKAKGELQLQMSLGCSAKGSVIARDGLDRVAGAKITVWLDSGQRVLTTNREGEFQLHDLAPQTIRLRIDHENYVQATRTFRIPKDQDPDIPFELPAINLQEAGFVEGEVIDDDGKPVIGAWVSRDKIPDVLPVGPLPPGVVMTDKEGKYRLPSLPEGQLTIQAYAPGIGRGQQKDVPVRTGRTTPEVRITLEKNKGVGKTPAWISTVAVQVKNDAGGKVAVSEVVPGSLADRAGIAVGDIIETIDGATPHDARNARKMLGGPQSKDVLLVLQRGDEKIEMRVGRESVRETGN